MMMIDANTLGAKKQIASVLIVPAYVAGRIGLSVPIWDFASFGHIVLLQCFGVGPLLPEPPFGLVVVGFELERLPMVRFSFGSCLTGLIAMSTHNQT